jgi:hypothetical protein
MTTTAATGTTGEEEWAEFTEVLAGAGADVAIICTHKELDGLMQEVWGKSSTLAKARAKTYWMNHVADKGAAQAPPKEKKKEREREREREREKEKKRHSPSNSSGSKEGRHQHEHEHEHESEPRAKKPAAWHTVLDEVRREPTVPAAVAVAASPQSIPPTQSAPPPPTPPSQVAANGPEKYLLEALDAMDGRHWADVRDLALAATVIDPEFGPALLLLRAVRHAMPNVFRRGDVRPDEALRRAQGAPAEKREKGRKFVERLTAPGEAATGARLFLAGYCVRLLDNDLTGCVALYRRAVQLGDMCAQFDLGACYSKGRGVEPNVDEASRWYTKAAELGHAGAQNSLGWSYRNGLGVARDYAAAAKWYRKAADAGDAEAQFSLGLAHQDGRGIEKDPRHATKWFRRAAEQGWPVAQVALAKCLERGEGVPARDISEALKWYRRAAELGNEFAREHIKTLEAPPATTTTAATASASPKASSSPVPAEGK